MGASASRLEKALGADFPKNERYFGFQNNDNTCYCNSVLQALYFHPPFRFRVIEHSVDFQRKYVREPSTEMPRSQQLSTSLHGGDKRKLLTQALWAEPSEKIDIPNDDTLLTMLGDLFYEISKHKKRTGTVHPRRFVSKLREENEIFRGQMHQDAQEFLNYLLNYISETLEKDYPKKSISHSSTFISDIFEGVLTNETKCLGCENVTSRDEKFLDLSLDIERNCSISACLMNFAAIETLHGQNKFFCDSCCCYQEAQKRMTIKRLPRVLALHLKRFKYVENLGRYKKLSYRIPFPMRLRVGITAAATENPDQEYELYAVVIHMGSGPSHGHYVSMIRSHGRWLKFDDDFVDLIDEKEVESVFGLVSDGAEVSSSTGYILFYRMVDEVIDTDK